MLLEASNRFTKLFFILSFIAVLLSLLKLTLKLFRLELVFVTFLCTMFDISIAAAVALMNAIVCIKQPHKLREPSSLCRYVVVTLAIGTASTLVPELLVPLF